MTWSPHLYDTVHEATSLSIFLLPLLFFVHSSFLSHSHSCISQLSQSRCPRPGAMVTFTESEKLWGLSTLHFLLVNIIPIIVDICNIMFNVSSNIYDLLPQLGKQITTYCKPPVCKLNKNLSVWFFVLLLTPTTGI